MCAWFAHSQHAAAVCDTGMNVVWSRSPPCPFSPVPPHTVVTGRSNQQSVQLHVLSYVNAVLRSAHLHGCSKATLLHPVQERVPSQIFRLLRRKLQLQRRRHTLHSCTLTNLSDLRAWLCICCACRFTAAVFVRTFLYDPLISKFFGQHIRTVDSYCSTTNIFIRICYYTELHQRDREGYSCDW